MTSIDYYLPYLQHPTIHTYKRNAVGRNHDNLHHLHCICYCESAIYNDIICNITNILYTIIYYIAIKL